MRARDTEKDCGFPFREAAIRTIEIIKLIKLGNN